jgi:hypothetical protein
VPLVSAAKERFMRFMRTIRVMLAAAVAACAVSASAAEKKKIVFIAGAPSHGFAQHEHNAGCLFLAKCLKESRVGEKIETVVLTSRQKDGKTVSGWPDDPKELEGAAAIIMFCDGGPNHMVIPHLKEVDALHKKGVGIGCIHYAVEVPKEKGGEEFLRWIGGYFETFYSVNPHWTANFKDVPQHPVASGVKPFTTNDEWYFHMRFRDTGVTPILSAVPPDSARQGRDDAHAGNPHVRAGVGKNIPETTVWVAQNENGSRGFGCTGAHFHFNWGSDSFRKTILNAIAWVAHVDVPAEGVTTQTPTAEELLANLDQTPAKGKKGKKGPDSGIGKEELQKQIDALNAGKTAGR